MAFRHRWKATVSNGEAVMKVMKIMKVMGSSIQGEVKQKNKQGGERMGLMNLFGKKKGGG